MVCALLHAALPDVRTGAAITSAVRASPGSPGPAVTLTTQAGEQLGFDAVVFATHSDLTLSILGQDADEEERSILGAIPYNSNDIYLHTGGHGMDVGLSGLQNTAKHTHTGLNPACHQPSCEATLLHAWLQILLSCL